MAIYGDMLAYFPEQFRNFSYFHMSPNSVASYTPREYLGQVRGIFQYMKKGELLAENETLEDTNVPTFWTKTKLKAGNFLEKEDELYRITNQASWLYEGGFYCYIVETFVGNSDSQEPFEDVDLGQNSYD